MSLILLKSLLPVDMMVAKRSPEKQDVPSSKKLKVADVNENSIVGNKSELQKSKSKKKIESILINPGNGAHIFTLKLEL